MKPILKLFLSSLKTYLRDKQALFWTIFFPIMFIILFGLFQFEKMGTSHIAVIDHAGSETSTNFIEGLKQIEIFKINEDEKDETQAKEKLEKGDYDFVLIVPENFKVQEKQELPTDINYQEIKEMPQEVEIPQIAIQLYYDEANTQLNPLVFGLLNQFINQSNLQAASAPEIFTLDAKPIKARDIGYLDILVPGILAMSMMMSAVNGISADISESRDKKILKRLFVTPLKTGQFLIAQVSAFLVIAAIQITIILLVSKYVFKVNIFGSYFLIFGVALFGCLLFLNIGFIIVGLVKSARAVEAITMVITMPMMFLSGTFFPKEVMPKIMAMSVDYLPLTPLVDALRKISVEGGGIGDLSKQFLYLGIWFVVLLVVAIRTFRFQEK